MIRGSITVTIPFTISGGIEAKLTQKKFKTLAKEAFATVLSDTSEALLKVDSVLHENSTEGKFVAKPAVFDATFLATTLAKVVKTKPAKKVKASPAPKKAVKPKKTKVKKSVELEESSDDTVEELD